MTYLQKQPRNNYLFVYHLLYITPFIFVKQLAYISNNKLWPNEFDGMVSKREKLQDLNVNQLKLEVHDTYKIEEDAKIKTNFDPTVDSDVINKSHLKREKNK